MKAKIEEPSQVGRLLWFNGLKPCCAHALKPVAYGVPIAVALFGIYELLEWLFVSEKDTAGVHFLHLLGGVVFSLLVATTVSWSIISSSPGFLPDPTSDATASGVLASGNERARRYAQWFVAMRWIAVLLASALVIISVRFLHWLPAEVWWPLVGGLGALIVSNVAYSILLRCDPSVAAVLVVQGYFDLAVLTVLLHFSGGIENPLSMMMVFHIIIGGVLLSKRQCYGLAAVGTLFFAVMAWAEWSDLVEHYSLMIYPHFQERSGELFHPAHHSLYACSRVMLHATVLFLTAYFVTSLADRLRQKERRLEVLAERAKSGQQLLERALETTGTALRVVGSDSKTYWTNARWTEWFETTGGRRVDATPLLDDTDAAARETLRDGQVRLTEVIVARAAVGGPQGGTDRTYVFQITTAPLRDSVGKLQQVVELAQDVTQQKQIQAQLVRAGQLAAVGELAGQVAHEVNNPIAIISAKTRLLLTNHRSDMGTKTALELEKITELADRVARISQGLLSYSRPTPATRERVDVRQPVRKCLALIDRHARTNGVAIRDELNGTVPEVDANAPQLEQVFLNLVINALDAMPDGGELRVSTAAVTLADGTAGVAVRVADTGTGIAPEIRARIFEPFFTTKQQGRGTGLGLSIGLGLVRDLGGEIEVESEVGKGTCFIVKLPAVAATKGAVHA